MDIVALFCSGDDFVQAFLPLWQTSLLPVVSPHRRLCPCRLRENEILTLLIAFHASDYRTFKHFYLDYVCRYWRAEFPDLVSYQRLVERVSSVLVLLAAYLHTRLGQTRGVAFVDSLPLQVCHNRRIHSHRVFTGMAQRGKSSVDWFYGFKLHFVINEEGELLALQLTPGNVDDRTPVPNLARDLWGKLFGDRGSISQKLFDQLWAEGVHLVSRLKRNMEKQTAAHLRQDPAAETGADRKRR